MTKNTFSGFKYAKDAVIDEYPDAELKWETIEGSSYCHVEASGKHLSYTSRSPREEWETAWSVHCKQKN